MIRLPHWLLPVVCLTLFPSSPASAQSLSFGNVSVDQNNAENTAAAVTLSLDYSHGSISIRPNGSNRGDFGLNFSATPAQDRANGILITTASQNGRDNSHAGDTPAVRYSTTANYNSGGSWAVSTINTGGGEWNTDFAAAWFPYAEGWIGGHAVASGGALTGASSALSSGLTISTSALGPNVIYDSPDAATPGVYEINLSGVNSMVDGILLTVGGDNADNYSLARANADGTWTVMVADNGTNGNSGENTAFGFVYVPKSKLVTSPDQAGVQAMGRVNGNMTRDVTAGDYVLVRTGLGTYELYAPGIDPAMATLLLGMELGTGDNILTYGSIAHGWEIANRDLPSAGLQDAGSGDMLSFAIMAGGNTAAVWDGGGANSNWSTGNNWVGDGLPTSGKDVILGTGGASVQIDSAQTAGMVFINRDTAFTISGSAPLTVNTGIIVNSAPTSAQTYTVSAPVILGNHAFIIAQSTGSGITLKFDVASGNAITSNNFNLTFKGGGTIELVDSVSLGTGFFIKEGDGQVNLYAANTVGGTVITSGYTGTGNASAFRFVAAGAWGAFGTGDIMIDLNRGGDTTTTVLYFDSGGGSGTLSNNIGIQSAVTNANFRIHLDSGAGLNGTLAGLISGGDNSSIFVVSSDAANGQGRLHLTNTGNTFIAEAIRVDGGALVVYGDSTLGDSENDIELNTNNTNNNKGSGLHFGADDVVLNDKRSVTITTDSVIHTQGFDATIAGVVSGAGKLIKEGEGTLSLTGVNTLTGKVRVNGGTLAINSEESLGSVPGAAAADQLSLNGSGVKALADLVIDDTTRGITVEATGGTFDTNGYYMRVDSTITALGQVDKRGAGTLELTALNSFAGMTVVHEGMLAVNNATGSVTGTSTVMVNAGATLAGKGSFNGAVIVEGNLGAGISSTGTLVFNNGLDLLAGSRTKFEIASDSDYDQIQVVGSPFGVDAEAIFEVIMTGTPMAGWTFDLMDWTFLSLDDDISDNFVLPDLSAWNLKWDRDNLSEGRLSISVAVVPEPSRALLLLGGGLFCLMRRRRPERGQTSK